MTAPRRSALVGLALVLLPFAGHAQTNDDWTIDARWTLVRLPPVPSGSVELDRAHQARAWNSRFCMRWIDGCQRCAKSHALAIDANCHPKEIDATCKPTAVRCLEFDQVIAPLFCTGMNDGCGSSSLAVGERGDDFSPASHDYCVGTKRVRPSVDWQCGTPTAAKERCSRPEGRGTSVSRKECMAQSLSVLRHYRRAIERLVRESRRNDIR